MLTHIAIMYIALSYAVVTCVVSRWIAEDWPVINNLSLAVMLLYIAFAPITLLGWFVVAIFIATFVKSLYPRS